MTLLLGPPGSGKSTLLLALAGKLAKNLKVSTFYYHFQQNVTGILCILLLISGLFPEALFV
jgi:DNA replication protein DnaC